MAESTLIMAPSPAWTAYRAKMEGLKVVRSAKLTGSEILREISDATDELVIAWFRESCQNENVDIDSVDSFVLFALGGYGRREMAPASDVDLMLLHEDDLSESVAKAFTKFTHRFYDARLHLGSSVRSLQGALEYIDSDLETLTAMLEGRLLLGSRVLAERFVTQLGKQVLKRSRKFLDRKIQERDARLASFGNSINIQEPHLKESPGGLRDYHQGIWLASLREGNKMTIPRMVRAGYITDRDEKRLKKALDFMFRLRCQLHWLGKGGDLVSIELQEKLAKAMGYMDSDAGLAEERLMRDYYPAASVIRQFANDVTEHCRPKSRWRGWLRRVRAKQLGDGFVLREGVLDIPDDLHFFENDPPRCMDLFYHLARTGAQISSAAEMSIVDNRALIDSHLMSQDRVKKILREMLSLPGSVAPTLRLMERLGIWVRVLPEWEHITSLVRHDLLHRYTVDEHTMLALDYLETLGEHGLEFSQERQELFNRLKHRDLMRILVLCHDIGKGRKRDHSVIGAELGRHIAERLGYTEAQAETLSFLIRHHLKLSHDSQRRDVNDPRVQAEIADFIGDKERLTMLYLLTHVDVMAVRPDMMTAWKNHLLWQLYAGVSRVLDDPTGVRRRPEEVIARQAEKSLETLYQRFGKEQVQHHLDLLPRDYLYRHEVSVIADHLSLIQEYDGKEPIVVFRDHVDERLQQLIVITTDRVGLFRRLCLGILLESFSIVKANLNTRTDGVVCNLLVIADEVETVRDREGGREILRERLCNLLKSQGELPKLPRPLGQQKITRRHYDTQVTIHNEISSNQTVVDVRTIDRTGIVLTMTEVFSEMRLSIQYANLVTEGSRVVDVFYLVDENGAKIKDAATLAQLKERLTERLEEFAYS